MCNAPMGKKPRYHMWGNVLARPVAMRFRLYHFLVLCFFAAFCSFFLKQSSNKQLRPVSFQRRDNSVQGAPGILVSIITIPRAQGKNYLKATLSSVEKQFFTLQNVMPGAHVIVISLRKEHDSWESARAAYGEQTVHNYQFLSLAPLDVRSNTTFPKGRWGTVKRRTVQHNLDVKLWLTKTHKTCLEKQLDFVLLMEDDFTWCTSVATHIVHILSGLRTYQNVPFSAVRISFGLNGLILWCSDLPAIYRMIDNEKTDGPPDTLLAEFLTGQTAAGKKYFASRTFMAYRYNLMEHIGMVSTVGNFGQDGRAIPQCFDILTSTGILQSERFDMVNCEEYKISPCNFLHDTPSRPFNLIVKDDLHLAKGIFAVARDKNKFADMLFLAGNTNETCVVTCKTVNSTCSEELMRHANDCIMLRGAFPCTSCGPSGASAQSWNMDVACPAFEVVSKHCDVCSRSGAMNCNSKSVGVSRLCPCVRLANMVT